MIKEKYFNLFKDAKTKEELLLIEWKANKSKNEYDKQILLKVFKKAYEILDKIEAIELNIIDILVLEYNKGNNVYEKALEICESNDIIINNIDSILSDEIAKIINNDRYKIVLNKIRYLLSKEIIKSKTLKKQNIDYSIAKKIIKMYFSSCVDNKEEFQKMTDCPRRWFNTALDILEVKNNPMYYKYQKRKREKFIAKRKISDKIKYQTQEETLVANVTNLSKDDIAELLKEKNSMELKKFGSLNNFNINLIVAINESDPNFLNEFLNDSSVYFVYEEQYKNLVKKVIDEIKKANATNNNEPINLYDYYLMTNISIERLASLAKTFNDVKDKWLLEKYLEKNESILELVDDKKLKIFLQTNHITCGNDTILFTNSEIKRALRNIEEQSMPLTKGTLYGAIKHQKELVKKKVN